MTTDAVAGRPLVAHVLVALCDNDSQGIVPVPRAIGDGSAPRTNLYWGAGYGVPTFLARSKDWQRVAHTGAKPPGVLAREVFRGGFACRGHAATVYVVADAWEGRRIQEAIRAFLEAASGRGAETIAADERRVSVGGAAHVLAFVGHNGLMEAEAPALASGAPEPARAAIVLACDSAPYFRPLLRRAQAQPLLLTTGLMAPEAYTLEAALRTWFSGGAPGAVVRAAAGAYDAYQHCGASAARRLFVGRGP